MDKVEELMSTFSDITFKIDEKMPDGQKGLYISNFIYLNPRQTKAEFTSTLAEEIGHYLTSVGDITRLDTNEKRKQEKKARDVGATILVTPSDIVDCFEEGYHTTQECASFLEVTEETFCDAVRYYARRYDGIKTEDNYVLLFNPDGTVGVFKSFKPL